MGEVVDLREWVARSREGQGKPAVVEDPQALAQVATLMGAA